MIGLALGYACIVAGAVSVWAYTRGASPTILPAGVWCYGVGIVCAVRA